MSSTDAAHLVRLSADVVAGRFELEDALGRAATEPAPVDDAPPDTMPTGASPPWQDPAVTLGERALAWTVVQLGQREEPLGSNGGPFVAKLLAPCVRRATGKVLGLTSGNWCAAMVCAAQKAALLPSETPVHGYRAAVSELVEDARASGAWLDVADVRSGAADVHPGDLAVFCRASEDPRLGGQGHVGRVETFGGDGSFTSCDGNHENRVARAKWHLVDHNLVGFVAYSPQKV